MTPGFEVAEVFPNGNRPGTSIVGRLLDGAVARHGDVLVDGDLRAPIENVGILGDRVQLVVEVPEGHELQPGQLLVIESPSY